MINGKTATTGTMTKRGAVILLLIALRMIAFRKQCIYFAINFSIAFVSTRHNAKCQNKESHYESKKFHRVQK